MVLLFLFYGGGFHNFTILQFNTFTILTLKMSVLGFSNIANQLNAPQVIVTLSNAHFLCKYTAN